MKKFFALLIILSMLLSFAIPSAYAEENTVNTFTDTQNELLCDTPVPNTCASSPLGAVPDSTELSCASFISNEQHSEYIDRMIAYYLNYNAELTETLKNGMPVVMLFDGGSDNTATDDYINTITYRNAAVCIVLKYNNKTASPYIAYYCENCTTMPDFPFYYDYDNGHTGYGSATALDGIYSIYTVNHRGIYAAYNVRIGSSGSIPSVYMKSDGTFSILNATGINVHTRIRNTVGDTGDEPTSAGCLLIGDTVPYTEFEEFIKYTAPESSTYTQTVFNEYPINRYSNSTGEKAGMIVIDRFLNKQKMYEVYENNKEAVECITAFSTACNADSQQYLKSCTVYPSYLTATAEIGAQLYTLPCTQNGSLCNIELTEACPLTVTAVYKNSLNEYWYRVFYNDETLYINSLYVKDTETNYSDITIHEENYPVIKQYKKPFTVKGITGSSYNKFTAVSGYIKSESGVTESTYTANVDCHSYSLNASDGATAYRQSLDYNLAFSGLCVGPHSYIITGTVKNYYINENELTYEQKEITLVNKSFSVAYAVTFDCTGGTAESTVKYTGSDDTLDVLPIPQRDGYKFAGWYTAPDGGEEITTDTVFSSHSTVYAHWKKIIKTERIYGKSRVQTAIKTATATFPEGADTVIIASGSCFADALCGAPLAYALNAPILLTCGKQSLEDDVLGALEQLGAKNVIILGGSVAVTDAAEQQLTGLYSVKRIFGGNRYETSVKIAEELKNITGEPANNAFIVNGANFPDAISIGTVAAISHSPILFGSTNASFNDYVSEYLKNSGINSAVIIGGFNAVNQTAEQQLEDIGITNINRIGGANRYETSALVNSAYSDLFNNTTAVIASGSNYPDALTGSVFAAKLGSPMIIVNKQCANTYSNYINEKEFDKFYILGGEVSVPEQMVSEYLSVITY